MTSAVDIVNLALSHIGDRATVASIDPPEGSAQAEHAARHYPMARDTALEEYAWSFSTTRRAIAQMPSPVPGWQYAYALPADALTVFEVLYADDLPSVFYAPQGAARVGFEMESDELTGLPLVVTNTPGATIRFARRVTDTSRFTPLFCDALSWLLASKLSGPILKGQAGAQAAERCYGAYTRLLGKAASRDLNQNTRRQNFVPSAIAARGGFTSQTRELDRFTRTETFYAAPDGLPKL